jgi:membrane dipeptidase
VFSHSSCRALVDNPRNVPDDVLRRLRDNGGVCMITFVPPFVSQEVSDWFDQATRAFAETGLDRGTEGSAAFWSDWSNEHPSPKATLSQVADHIEHAREVVGVDHIGIGGDFDGVRSMPEGLPDVSCYPALLNELADRGWSGDELIALMGENVLRVLAEADRKSGDTQH